jgi:S-adenosyl-L-methionine hydrolase (adenosine-forming)
LQLGHITLLTDYGPGNSFVGSLHAAILQIAPEARIIDLDHSVPAFDVRVGALRLEGLLPIAPEGVHVGVVDPGVGGSRRPVLLEAGRNLFVGPDNGLLVWAVERWRTSCRAFVLDRTEFWRPDRAVTFDGRDIFAPVAAHLAIGIQADELGTRIAVDDLVELQRPHPTRLDDGWILVEVIDIDRFGNLALGARVEDLARLEIGGGSVAVAIQESTSEMKYGSAFSDVGEGEPLIYLDSTGWLSLAFNRGNAARVTGLERGERLKLRNAE